MTVFHLKFAGLADTDANTIKSMLRLSNAQLSQRWEVVERGEAELIIYAFDSEEGRIEWENRGDNLTASLIIKEEPSEAVDIIFRKPLRKSNFAEALNKAAELLTAHQKSAQPTSQAKTQDTTKPSLRSWIDKVIPKSTPNPKLPKLHFDKMDNSGEIKSTITEVPLLLTWIAQLPDDSTERANKLLTNLTRLNKIELKPQQHIELLEIYLTNIKQLLLTRDSSAVKRDLYLTTAHLKVINGISSLILTLKEGYRKALAAYYFAGDTPKYTPYMLLCINRIAEVAGILALHSHQYYRTVTPSTWQQLHELYLYLEAIELLHDKVDIQNQHSCESFYPLYLQTILINLADPYSLNKFEVLRLYILVLSFIDKTSIALPTSQQTSSDSNFFLTGIYTIACNQDKQPVPMYITPSSLREAKTTRALNIQPLLLFLENETKQLKQRPVESLDLDQQLLLKIAPKLQTDRERRYHRLKTAKHRPFTLTVGIKATHHNLNHDSHAQGTEWNMSNQSSGGLMAHRRSDQCEAMSIGDLVGIFEQDYPLRLAIVRWLQIDLHDETYIGLEYIEGKPDLATCMPDGVAEQHPALLLPAVSEKEPESVYMDAGQYSPKRKFRVKKPEGEPYLIAAGQLISKTMTYEQFSYKVIDNS